MPKPQQRKETSFQTEQVRSVFFTGKPNKQKWMSLEHLQSMYTDGVNHFIGLLDNNQQLLMPVIKNDKHDDKLREFEKNNRAVNLGSAMSQAAFDDAVTMLSNRYECILQKMRSVCYDAFTESKVLFCMSIQGCPKDKMIVAMNDIADATKRNADFYRDKARLLAEMSIDSFNLRMQEFTLAYYDAASVFRLPHVSRSWVSLDSRTCKLVEAEHVKTSHVIEITDPQHRGRRISIPVETSKNSLRRMKQYGYSKSCRYTITDDHKLRVSIAFTKRVSRPITDETVGVDTGILDCLYTSDGNHYGSFKEPEDYYKDVVEPSLGQLSALRNKKAKILYFVHTHKDLPDSVRRSLLDKVNRLEGMIQTAKEPDHKLRVYHQKLQEEISRAVKAYISSIDKSKLTVLELLDIREFDKGRKANGRLSMFARGELQRKLMAELNWHGYDFQEVDPAYTSQLCPECSNVDKKNRNGKQFCCTCCGLEMDADHNAAGNIKARATDTEILAACTANRYNTENRHAALKKIYGDRHQKWIELKEAEGLKITVALPQQSDG